MSSTRMSRMFGRCGEAAVLLSEAALASVPENRRRSETAKLAIQLERNSRCVFNRDCILGGDLVRTVILRCEGLSFYNIDLWLEWSDVEDAPSARRRMQSIIRAPGSVLQK